jgi:hypothetical protein
MQSTLERSRALRDAHRRVSGQDDVPALLRRVADTIEKRGEIDVMDITFENETTAEGPWPSLTVYYHRRDPQSGD